MELEWGCERACGDSAWTLSGLSGPFLTQLLYTLSQRPIAFRPGSNQLTGSLSHALPRPPTGHLGLHHFIRT